MSRSLVLLLVLAGSSCLGSNLAVADGRSPQAAEGAKTSPPPPPPPPPPPEAPSIYYATPPPPPPPPQYDPSKPQSDPTAGIQAPPEFPEDEACRGIGGSSVVLISYDRLGHVTQVQVEKTSGNRSLDRAAVNAAYHWRINPGSQGGVPVAGRVRVPVEFAPGHAGGWWCDSAIRIQDAQLGRKVKEGSEDRIEYTRSLSTGDVALLQVSYIAMQDKPPTSIEVDWYRDDGSHDPIYHHDSKPLAPGRAAYEFRLGFANGWRPGIYLAIVRVDGLVRRKLQFSVAGDGSFPELKPAAQE